MIPDNTVQKQNPLIMSGPFTQEESAARAKREADLYWK